MGKYLVLWEIDPTKIPIDPKERGEGWGMLMAMVRQDFEKGILKDWGAFVGESNGYAVSDTGIRYQDSHWSVQDTCRGHARNDHGHYLKGIFDINY